MDHLKSLYWICYNTAFLCFFFLFVFFFFGSWGILDLSSLTRDQTPTPFFGTHNLNHWTAKEALEIILGFSQKSYEKRVCVLRRSVTSDFATIWNVACQAPLSMRFSRQEYWSGLPFPPPEGLLDLRIKLPISPVSPALAGRFFTTCTTWEVPLWDKYCY